MQPKESLRSAALSRRAAMSAAEREQAGIALVAALRDLVQHAERVAAYVPFGSEPPITAILGEREDILIPVLLPDNDLEWSTGDVLHGPDAIAGCDVVLVPALAVDRHGNRLGRGGGSYDRALRRATGVTIAVLYDGEWVEQLPAEAHDTRVGAVVMPSTGLVRLG
ncbi:MAG: 5-formyltetrahydrofolate cyclo-ligase [Frankiaceae bacterium]|nr:5-formyltetrahydrofolate cyclo-ligase [Frankiaceae bacterium]